jgi:alpha-beta hydrolase superfamily lysophospholipase
MKFLITLFLLLSSLVFSQQKNFNTEEITVDSLIKGSLFLPKNNTKKTKLVILIAGSGPTNRYGNQFGGVSNNLKFLAEDLVQKNIAVFSYDKRIFSMMKSGNIDEKIIRFEDMIIDAQNIVKYFRKNKRFKKIIIAGHSEGALVGMATSSSTKVDGFVSLAGAGRPIHEVLEDQLIRQLPQLSDEIKANLKKYKEGTLFEYLGKNPTMTSIFKPSIQPYMISWARWNPITEIEKLKIPILIINGTQDLQVSESDAKLLKKAAPEAQIEIIENMNHLFKNTPTEKENRKSYNDGSLPIMPILTEKMVGFIKSI